MVIVTETRGGFSSARTYEGGDEIVRLRKNQSRNKYDDPETQNLLVPIPEYIVSMKEHRENRQVVVYLICRSRLIQSILSLFGQIFLPFGYPNSVSQDYVNHQFWDTIQNFASSISFMIASESVMITLGVGDKNAQALSAALIVLFRSMSTSLGKIFFVWFKGSAFDYDNKKWRFVADVVNDIVIFGDMMSPMFPSNYVLAIFCASSFIGALSGVGGSATRVAVAYHQSRNNNIADVSAKNSSQEQVVSLLGSLISAFLLPLLSGRDTWRWSVFGVCTFVHLMSNYLAIKALQFETFNSSRLLLCIQQYLTIGSLHSIRHVNRVESFLLGFGISGKDVCNFDIRLGVSLEEALNLRKRKYTRQSLQRMVEKYQSMGFMITRPNPKTKKVCVVLTENVQPCVILEGFVRAIFAAHFVSAQQMVEIDGLHPLVTEKWLEFLDRIQTAGYDVNRSNIQTQSWRSRWDSNYNIPNFNCV